MKYDRKEYKIWDWKHPIIWHWIINPGLVINDLLLGQTMPKVILIERHSNKPLFERSKIPCPHCGTLHPSVKFSRQNKTVFKNWFGYYCDACTKIIPVHRNLTSLLVLFVTSPLWIWFYKSAKNNWLARQPERFKNVNLNIDTSKNNTKNWLFMGLVWGTLMYLLMLIIIPLIEGEEISHKSLLVGIPVWLIMGLFFGLGMKFWMNRKGETKKAK